jgi:hypothetical protein
LLLGVAVSLPSDRGFAASLQQTSELKSLQKKFGVPRTSWGSFSEARQVLERAWERDRLYVKDRGYAFVRAVQRSTPS